MTWPEPCRPPFHFNLDIREDGFDEAQMATWVKQSAALPGWVPGRTDQTKGKTARARKKPKSDWRDETLARVRALILDADPEMIEERKWKKPSNAMAGVPVWSRHGIVLHRGEVHDGCEADIRTWSQPPRSVTPFQFQPGRQHPASDRYPRRGDDRRPRDQGAREGRRAPERIGEETLATA